MEKSVHPTAIMLTSTVNLLKTLSLSSGIHAEVMQVDAISTLCGLLRILVESGANDKTGNFFSLLIMQSLSFMCSFFFSFPLSLLKSITFSREGKNGHNNSFERIKPMNAPSFGFVVWLGF